MVFSIEMTFCVHSRSHGLIFVYIREPQMSIQCTQEFSGYSVVYKRVQNAARSKTRISRISRIFFSNFYKSKTRMFENLGFFSAFSIFATGEYRKHGCLETSVFLKSQFSILTRQMFEIRGFQTSVFSNIENTDVGNLGFLKSQF